MKSSQLKPFLSQYVCVNRYLNQSDAAKLEENRNGVNYAYNSKDLNGKNVTSLTYEVGYELPPCLLITLELFYFLNAKVRLLRDTKEVEYPLGSIGLNEIYLSEEDNENPFGSMKKLNVIVLRVKKTNGAVSKIKLYSIPGTIGCTETFDEDCRNSTLESNTFNNKNQMYLLTEEQIEVLGLLVANQLEEKIEQINKYSNDVVLLKAVLAAFEESTKYHRDEERLGGAPIGCSMSLDTDMLVIRLSSGKPLAFIQYVNLYYETSCHIQLSYTDPSYRRLGLHTLLFNRLVRECKDNNIKHITSGTHANNHVMQKVYEKQGRIPTAIMYALPL